MIEWILADASFQGAVRFATVCSVSERLTNEQSFESTAFSTFTEAILHYAALNGIDPRRAGCVLAVPGPVFPGTISIARSRWTLSRDGVAQLFGGNAFMLNDVMAVAWSLLAPRANLIEPLIGATPRPADAGRRVVILLDDGVGAAVIASQDGNVGVEPSEPGHCGFAPRTAQEAALFDALRSRRLHVSWEQALCDPSISETEAWAAMAGEFVGDALLATAAWSGAILTGKQALRLLAPEAKAAFSARLASKSKYARQVGAAPMGLVRQRDPLAGCLEFIRRRTNQAAERPTLAAA